jgi:hypothetical protein
MTEGNPMDIGLKTFLHLPIPPQTDFTFTANEIAGLTTDFWDSKR